MDPRTTPSNCIGNGNSRRITVRFDPGTLDRVDDCVEGKSEFNNRSQLIRAAVGQLLDDIEKEPQKNPSA